MRGKPATMSRVAPATHLPGGGGGGATSSVRTVLALSALALVGVTVSSVRYLAASIAVSHHASLHDPSLDFEDPHSWHTFNQHVYAHLAEAMTLHHSIQPGYAANAERYALSLQPGATSKAARPQGGDLTGVRPQPLALESPKLAHLPDIVTAPEPGAAKPKPGAGESGGKCRVELQDHTEYWGDVVGEWGANRKLDSAEECCIACQSYSPASPEDLDCNVWVYCGRKEECKHQYRECWLKHLAWTGASRPNAGPHIPWTSGVVDSGQHDSELDVAAEEQELNPNQRAFHTVTTAQGSPTHWQMRIHYYWWKKQKAKCQAEGSCMMGGFTRLLHSGVRDDLMGEIPTFVANPLPKDTPTKGYVVLNRPYAFVQWMRQSPPPEKYILMSEPDHVFLKPIPNLMRGSRPAAFPFFYIEPSKKEFKPITEKFLGPLNRMEAEKIAPIGSSPTFIKTEDLARVAPVWMNMSIAIFNDPEANKAWGWVLEMYGFTLALSKLGIGPVDVHLKMMAQPPWDTEIEPYYIIHFTYGMDYTLDGVFTPGKYGQWRFDKRSYATRPIPRHMEEPPQGCKNHLVRRLIQMFNEATDDIPGWDTYVKTYRP